METAVIVCMSAMVTTFVFLFGAVTGVWGIAAWALEDESCRLSKMEDRIEDLEESTEQNEEEVMELQTCLYGIEDEEGEYFPGLIKNVEDIDAFQSIHADCIGEIEDVLYGEDLEGTGLIEVVHEHIYGDEDKAVDCKDCNGDMSKCVPEKCTKPTTFAFEDTDLEPSLNATVEESVVPSLFKDKVEVAKVIEGAANNFRENKVIQGPVGCSGETKCQ